MLKGRDLVDHWDRCVFRFVAPTPMSGVSTEFRLDRRWVELASDEEITAIAHDAIKAKCAELRITVYPERGRFI